MTNRSGRVSMVVTIALVVAGSFLLGSTLSRPASGTGPTAPVLLNQLTWDHGCVMASNQNMNYWLCDQGLDVMSTAGYSTFYHVISFNYTSNCGSDLTLDYVRSGGPGGGTTVLPPTTGTTNTFVVHINAGERGYASVTLTDRSPTTSWYVFMLRSYTNSGGCGSSTSSFTINNVQIYGH